MATLDYIYRLKPQAGDTTLHNEVNPAQTLSGGTAVLTDLGGGVFSWRVSGSNFTGITDAVNMVLSTAGTNGGVTVAVVAKPVTQSTTRHALLSWGQDSTPQVNDVNFRYYTENNIYWQFGSTGNTFPMAPYSVGTLRTYVMRLVKSASGSSERNEIWWTGGAGGTTPDSTSTTFTGSDRLLDTLTLELGSGTHDIVEIVLWPNEKTNAECNAIRNDIAAALATSDGAGPTFTSSATFSVPENTTAVGTVTATDATGPVTFSIVGGADAARFSITSGGVLTFVAAPNFDAPNDADTNNTYVVTVRATDAVTPTPNTTDQTITVTVTNVSPEVAPGTPGGMVAPAVQPVPVQVTFGTATDAATYEMRLKRGTDAFGSWVTGLATPVNIFTGVELDTIYTVECVGRNAIGASATAASATFRVTNSGVTVDGSTFVAALLAVLNP